MYLFFSCFWLPTTKNGCFYSRLRIRVFIKRDKKFILIVDSDQSNLDKHFVFYCIFKKAPVHKMQKKGAEYGCIRSSTTITTRLYFLVKY